jgi:molybdopterin synthase sulfur carrier subunit
MAQDKVFTQGVERTGDGIFELTAFLNTLLAMRVRIPSALRKFSGGNEIIEVPLARDMMVTVAEVFAMLAREYPGIRQRVLDDQGNLRRHVNVFVDGENVRYGDGLAARVGPDSEVSILPALSGGCRMHGDSNREAVRPT